jgi:hypothetical protein
MFDCAWSGRCWSGYCLCGNSRVLGHSDADALGHGVVEELVVGDIEEVDAVHQGGGKVASMRWRSPNFSHVLRVYQG